MKSSFRYLPVVLLGLAWLPLSSCVTDEYGNQAVSPGGAVALALGAAVAGAAIAESANHHHDHHRHHDRYGHRHHHHGGYYY